MGGAHVTGTRNTNKQVGASRRKSIKNLKNGKWKQRFDETLTCYRNESNPEIKDSLKSSLHFQARVWGISNFPELQQYAQDELTKLKGEPVEKLSPAEFVKRWRTKGREK